MKVTKKIVINAIAFVLLGAAFGFIVGQKRCKSSWYGNHADRQAFYLNMYTKRLDLNPEQQEQAKVIIETRSKDISAILKEMRPKFREARNESDLALIEILSEEQRSEFKKLQAEFDEYRKKRWGNKSDRSSK